MTKSVWFLGSAASALLATAAPPAAAAPVPCGGGTLDISATSDTPLTGTAYNVGQKATFTAIAVGVTPTSFAWTIPGPHIKDYSEDLGTRNSPAPPNPLPWTTTPVSAADLTQSTVSLYWKPSPAQVHPLNGPPEARLVALSVNTGSGPCNTSVNVTVERNLTDPDRQPEDYYTSTHRAPATTNVEAGNVVDEHIYWHQFVGGGAAGSWLQFLAWHTYFLGRFDEWRAEFGYPEVAPWYPGRPLPTGPEFDQKPSLRIAYTPSGNKIPFQFTLAGSPPSGANPLGTFASLNGFSSSFEGGYHGNVHCNIGSAVGGFFDTNGPGYGSMCRASSPKDPMFFRWHGFIDRLYRNYCTLKGISCHSPAAVPSNPWMGDNVADIAAGGVAPSPGPRWMSPDIWNRRSEVTTDSCIPRTTPPNLNTVGGVTRNCGSDADHENPVTGQTNFLYATLRNTSGTPQRNVYAEVAVYIANASTGLSWPADFAMLPDSRQMITLNLEPGQVTQIGPLPWTPPSPSPSDHWCIYIRVLSVQEAPAVEGPVVDTNVANSNSIAWRNLKIVNPGEKMMSSFIVRNIRREGEELALEVITAPELMQAGRVVVTLDARLQRAAEKPVLRGAEDLGRGRFLLREPQAILAGFKLPPRGEGAAVITLEGVREGGPTGDIIVVQRSRAGIDGGVTLRVAKPARKRRPY